MSVTSLDSESIYSNDTVTSGSVQERSIVPVENSLSSNEENGAAFNQKIPKSLVNANLSGCESVEIGTKFVADNITFVIGNSDARCQNQSVANSLFDALNIKKDSSKRNNRTFYFRFMCSLWHWLILVFLLDLSCSAYNPFFALQKWPLEVPHWFHRVFSTPDTPHFYSPSLQSPINIRSSHAAVLRLPPLIFKDLFRDEVELQCQNTGTTVEFELPEHTSWRPKLLGGPLFNEGVFEFDNLHIHWGARDFIGGEHKINSRRYAVEGHCVHFNSKYGNKSEAMKHPDGLAVVAFFGKAGNTDNPLVEKLVRKLPYIRLPGSSITVNAHEALEWLEELGEPRNYFAYPGSLTTPPYTENVMWIVYPRPVSLSSRQVEAFRNILSNNYQLLRKNIRPVQSFNSRPLIYAV